MKDLDMWEFTVRVQRTPDYLEAWLFHESCAAGVLIGHTTIDLDSVVEMASRHTCSGQGGTDVKG